MPSRALPPAEVTSSGSAPGPCRPPASPARRPPPHTPGTQLRLGVRAHGWDVGWEGWESRLVRLAGVSRSCGCVTESLTHARWAHSCQPGWCWHSSAPRLGCGVKKPFRNCPPRSRRLSGLAGFKLAPWGDPTAFLQHHAQRHLSLHPALDADAETVENSYCSPKYNYLLLFSAGHARTRHCSLYFSNTVSIKHCLF